MDAAGAKGEFLHRRGELAEEANTTLSPILDFSLASDNTAVDLIEIIWKSVERLTLKFVRENSC